MLEKLTAKQLTEWELYYKAEPFGEDLGFYQAAIIASTMANIHRGKKSRAFKTEDFLPSMYQTKRKPQIMEQIKLLFTAMADVRTKRNA